MLILQRSVELVKLLVIFALLTLLFYVFMTWLAQWMVDDPDQPKGRSVVVQSSIELDLDSLSAAGRRIMVYYWLGE